MTFLKSRKTGLGQNGGRHSHGSRSALRSSQTPYARIGAGIRLLAALISLSVLSACATQQASLPPLDDSPMNSRVTDPAARRQLQLGNPIAAADVYIQRANRASTPEEKQNFTLLAGEILFDRMLIAQGQQRISGLPAELASQELNDRRNILAAKVYLDNSEPMLAFNALPDPNTVESAFHRARIYETRAQGYGQLQDPDNELIARIQLEQQLNNPEIASRGHEQIWRLLTTQPLSTLRQMTTNVRGDIYQGWIELALTNATSGTQGERRIDGIRDWQMRFPRHPANPEFASSLLAPSEFESNPIGEEPINQIAVLLPLSGTNTAAVSGAIRDGLIAAHDHAKSSAAAPVLRFYDIGENAGYVRTAYSTAIADGADAVVGPLRKDAVAAIVSQRDVPVPTLTLNMLQTSGAQTSAANIIQFGLAPEDEARSAAARAAGLTLRNAIIFQADDSRGEREARAFQEAMYQYGGDVAHIAILPKDEYDYSKQIKEALGIDKSDQRFKTLSRTIGEKLFFEPSIRSDIDVVFLALTSEQARSVRPQLDFFHARSITRLGTSRIAAVDDDAKENKDLNTIFYPDVPWTLRKSMKRDPVRSKIIKTFPSADGVYAKLYAMGADAYQIITNLNALQQGQRLQGYTGGLELTTQGRIQRHLDWAQYVEGVSQTVESIDAPALPSITTSGLN